jgi:hypothetical protein
VPNHDAWADVAARTETRRIVGLMIVVEEGETKSAPPTAFMAVCRKTRRGMTSISMRHLRHKRVLRRAPRLALNTRFARETTKEAPQRMKMLYKNMSRERNAYQSYAIVIGSALINEVSELGSPIRGASPSGVTVVL